MRKNNGNPDLVYLYLTPCTDKKLFSALRESNLDSKKGFKIHIISECYVPFTKWTSIRLLINLITMEFQRDILCHVIICGEIKMKEVD